jgi:hypothetical protein
LAARQRTNRRYGCLFWYQSNMSIWGFITMYNFLASTSDYIILEYEWNPKWDHLELAHLRTHYNNWSKKCNLAWKVSARSSSGVKIQFVISSCSIGQILSTYYCSAIQNSVSIRTKREEIYCLSCSYLTRYLECMLHKSMLHAYCLLLFYSIWE